MGGWMNRQIIVQDYFTLLIWRNTYGTVILILKEFIVNFNDVEASLKKVHYILLLLAFSTPFVI